MSLMLADPEKQTMESGMGQITRLQAVKIPRARLRHFLVAKVTVLITLGPIIPTVARLGRGCGILFRWAEHVSEA